MSERMFSKKKNSSLYSSSKHVQRKGLFHRQPFAPHKDIPDDKLPDLQTRWERAKTPNYVFQYLNPQPAPTPAVDTGNIQRQEDGLEDQIQTLPLEHLQLQEALGEKPEEDLQASLRANIQRQENQETEEEPEDLQTKLLPNIQRTETPQEDENLQTKSLGQLQRTKTEEENPEELQTKLTVGTPGDKYEQEADQMVVKVMTMPEPETPQLIQRETGEDEEVQMKPLAKSITPYVIQKSEEKNQMNGEGLTNYGKINPYSKVKTNTLIGKKVEEEESQARVEAKNALDKAKTELTRKYKLHKLRKLLNTSPEEFLESMKNTLLSIETQFENALTIQDSKSAIQQLRQVKEGADSFEKMLQSTLKEIIPAESQTQDEKQNTQKQETKQRKIKGWNLDETIEKQLQSRGQLSALNRIPGSSLSPLSSQEVRSLNPKQLEKRLQDLVDSGEIDQKRKNKIMRTVRKFFEDRDLTHGQ